MNGDNVNGVDSVDTVHICRSESASRESGSEVKEMALNGDHIDGVDIVGPRWVGSFARSHSIVTTGYQPR